MITLSVTLRASKLLLVATLAMAFLASYAVWVFLDTMLREEINPQVALTLSLICLCCLIFVCIWRWKKFSITSLDIAADGNLILRQRIARHTTKSEEIRLGEGAVIWPVMMVLHFLTRDNTKISFVLLPDSTIPSSFQRLRVSLLWLRRHQMSSGLKKKELGGNLN